jgi:hypothetical protein
MLSTLNFSGKRLFRAAGHELGETLGMHRTLLVVSVCALTACASKGAPVASSPAPSIFAERDGTGTDADACAPYLAGAPPERSGEFMPVSEEMMREAMASVAHETQPRCSHYQLIHRILATQILDDPRIAMALWERDDTTELLDAIATIVNDMCVEGEPGAWTMPAASFRIGRTELLGRPVVVVDVLPAPIATTEAHMFAVVGVPWTAYDDHRTWPGLAAYFVLEHSVSQGPNHTVMGAWTRIDGALTHLNMGKGPKPDPGGFVHAIGKNLCGDFVEMRTRV